MQTLSVAEYVELNEIGPQAKSNAAEAAEQDQTSDIPYNLDAWDGYAYERDRLFAAAHAYGSNLIVLSGDTHNSWASNLRDISGNAIGVEFAGTSISSPGMEATVSLTSLLEPAFVGMIEDLQYANLTDRGYLTVTFTETPGDRRVDLCVDRKITRLHPAC